MSASPLPERGALAVIAAATFFSLVVFTAPLTTLDAMTVALDLTASGQAWVMSGMPLGAACGLLVAGAFGDTFGRRITFAGGLWLTALSSAGAALADTGLILIAMRVIQGLGSAGIMACGLGLLGQIYHGEPRRRAAAIWAGALGSGVAAGPIIASVLIRLDGWAGIHWATTIASALLGIAARTRLPESTPSGARADLLGGALLMAGLSCLLSTLTEARFGVTMPVGALSGAGIALLWLFLLRERAAPNPVLPLDLFRHGDFTGATLAAFASGAGVLALLSMVSTFLVRATEIVPFGAAIILLAWSATTAAASFWTNLLPDTLSPRGRVVLALSGCAIGQLLTALVSPSIGWVIVLPGLFLAGLSNGILNAALGHAAVESVPDARAAMGSAANNTARYLGSALGIALVSMLISGAEGAELYLRWHQAVLATAAFSGIGALAMLTFHDSASP